METLDILQNGPRKPIRCEGAKVGSEAWWFTGTSPEGVPQNQDPASHRAPTLCPLPVAAGPRPGVTGRGGGRQHRGNRGESKTQAAKRWGLLPGE